MASVGLRVLRLSKLVESGVQMAKLAAVRGRGIGTKAGELLKGTTIRDIYLKWKQMQYPKGAPLPRRMGWRPAEEDDEDQRSGAPAADVAVALKRLRIVVTDRLPLRAEPNPDAAYGFEFSLDADALPLQLSRGLPEGTVIFVGALPPAAAGIAASEEFAAYLLDNLSCWPVFLEVGLDAFCNNYLRPALYDLTVYGNIGGGGGPNFNAEQYEGFLTATEQYAYRVHEILNPEEDLVFIHGYQLWALPNVLRHKSPRARIGFFPHSPFPSSSVLEMPHPDRQRLLLSALDADLVAFSTYYYARLFVSACGGILGVGNHYQYRDDYIGLNYYGHAVKVKFLSAGVDLRQIRNVLSSPETAEEAEAIAGRFRGLTMLLGVDGIDHPTGIRLKLQAMEKLLDTQPEFLGQVVLVQINKPARSPVNGIHRIRTEVEATRRRVNARFSFPGYVPVVLIDGPMDAHMELAFYTSADICIVTSGVHDGLDSRPSTYTLCRQEGPVAGGLAAGAPRESAIVLSRWVESSLSLSGVLVNPSVVSLAGGMNSAIRMNEHDRQIRHDHNFRYVSTHDVLNWSQTVDQELRSLKKV